MKTYTQEEVDQLIGEKVNEWGKAHLEDMATWRRRHFEEAIGIVGIHDKDDDMSYCDTGEDMEFSCRSECVDMAIKRLNKAI